jgi:hypothetical protein
MGWRISFGSVDKFVEDRSGVSAAELNENPGASSMGATESVWTIALVVLIALGASFLGNDETASYAEAVPVIGIGILLIVFPWRGLPSHAGWGVGQMIIGFSKSCGSGRCISTPESLSC